MKDFWPPSQPVVYGNHTPSSVLPRYIVVVPLLSSCVKPPTALEACAEVVSCSVIIAPFFPMKCSDAPESTSVAVESVSFRPFSSRRSFPPLDTLNCVLILFNFDRSR